MEKEKHPLKKKIITFQKQKLFFFYLNNEWKTNDLCLDVLKIIFKKSELNGNKIVGQLQ